MIYYFKLQTKRLERMFQENGIKPVLGYLLVLIIFISSSLYLFHKTTHAALIYFFLAISLIIRLGEKNRVDFISLIFPKKSFTQIRLTENLITSIPFTLILVYEKEYLFSLLIPLCSILTALFHFRMKWNFTIPTPFKKYPFEYIVGFRKTFFLYALSYFLCFKAVQIDNFKLGLFSAGLIFIIGMLFYIKPEAPYFVWIFSTNSKSFLIRKIKSSFLCSLLAALPILIVLMIFYSENYLIISGITILGLILLLSIIMVKYSSFPFEISLPEALLYATSLWFPPLLIFTIPFFYLKSKNNLESILE